MLYSWDLRDIFISVGFWWVEMCGFRGEFVVKSGVLGGFRFDLVGFLGLWGDLVPIGRGLAW
jgi:hypothetical protein